TVPVAAVEATAPEPPPIRVAVRMVDPSVEVVLAGPDAVAIDARSLKLPPALRAHLAHQSRDEDAIGALGVRRWEASGRASGRYDGCRNGPALEKAAADAQRKLDDALKRYETWSSAAITELGAAN